MLYQILSSLFLCSDEILGRYVCFLLVWLWSPITDQFSTLKRYTLWVFNNKAHTRRGKAIVPSEFFPGFNLLIKDLSIFSARDRPSCLCLSQPRFKAEETWLVEYCLLDLKAERDPSAPLSWTKTISRHPGDVRTLPIINQECKVSKGEGANQKLWC